jgi:hypothetical protein
MDYLTAYAYLLIAPMSLISSLFLALLGTSSSFREPPGNLICMIAFAELLLSGHYFLSALFTTWITNKTYGPESIFCQVNAIVAIFAGLLAYCYNIFFLLTVIRKMKNLINRKVSILCSSWFIHIISWAIPISTVIYAYIKGMFGISHSGTCSFTMSHTPNNNSESFGLEKIVILVSNSLIIVLAVYT